MIRDIILMSMNYAKKSTTPPTDKPLSAITSSIVVAENPFSRNFRAAAFLISFFLSSGSDRVLCMFMNFSLPRKSSIRGVYFKGRNMSSGLLLRASISARLFVR